MRSYLTQVFATCILVAALLAPFAGGWAMALGVADGRLIVICSGDGLRTIYVDENGDATQLTEEAVACILKSAGDTAQTPRPAPSLERLLFVSKSQRPVGVSYLDPSYLISFPRAPPLI